MDVRPPLARRFQRSCLAAATVFAPLACVVAACLPSIAFDSSATDGGLEGASPDGTLPLSDGGADARSIGQGDGGTDGAAPDGSTGIGPFANSLFFGYAQTAACAVRGGTLYCWGDQGANQDGELGFPDEDAGGMSGVVDPMPVTTTAHAASQIAQIVMGEYHTCALYGSQPYCWGANEDNQLGNDNDDDGGPTEQAVTGLPAGGLSSLAASSWATCGITVTPSAGNVSNVYCWGDNSFGELGRSFDSVSSDTALPVTGEIDGGPLGVISNATQLAGGNDHFCALTSAREILCWGVTDEYECGTVRGALICPQQNDQVTCTQQPLEVTLPTNLANEPPIAIAAGDHHTCALTQLGNVYCWGLDDSSQLGNATISTTCGSANGAPCTGSPVKVGVSGIQHLYAGGATTCAVDATGAAYCWGNNSEGELGQGDTDPHTTPQKVLDRVSANAILFDEMAVGRYSVCGRSGEELYCWGGGVLGTATDAAAPNAQYPALVQF